MMIIQRSIDIEDEVRKALSGHITAYCRPLPKNYSLPCVLIQRVGGSDSNTIDSFEVVIDARAEHEADADETLRNAIGILKAVAAAQTTALRYIDVNSMGSWDEDPVRPELAMCSARIRVIAHEEQTEV